MILELWHLMHYQEKMAHNPEIRVNSGDEVTVSSR